ncbi:fimbria/pilus outer membrane usher protein [Aeromonas sobria]|uniref:fimbria/pilus outer membrane usher protein n=1 Tax=Aeromonas sobria TaxID=646 RepID=UPI0013969661|nr:fimbria/pilus outer membrane usher protein [Aeromonas sobria]
MRISPPAIFIGVACHCLSIYGVVAKEFSFSPSWLGKNGGEVNLSILEKGGQLPGAYDVLVLLNGKLVDNTEIVFSQIGANSDLQPCLNQAQLVEYGIKVENYPRLFLENKDALGGKCANLSAIEQSRVDFDFYQMRLLLSIPQVAIKPLFSGMAPISTWDDGLPVFRMNYSANVVNTEISRRTGGAFRENSEYFRLEPGVNLGAWRFRNSSAWQSSSGKWSSSYAYAERGFYDAKSRLVLGERYTPSEIFGGVPFRGVMLKSDGNMVPYSQRSFVPMVRGIARTQARIEVKQDGYTIYDSVVAPGAFELIDLSTVGSGDLSVTVWETDGRPQRFVVPFSSPAIAVRKGYLDYHVMAGQYNSAIANVANSGIAQAAFMYGTPWDVTLSGGVQAASEYQSAVAGVGKSYGYWGALSFDMTQSWGQRNNKPSESGVFGRIRYSVSTPDAETSLFLDASRYSSTFNSLSDVLDTYTDGGYGNYRNAAFNDRKKDQLSLGLIQRVGRWGSVNINASRGHYWWRSGSKDYIRAGYSTYWRDISISFDGALDKNISASTDRVVSMNVSVPFEMFWASYRAASSTGRAISHEVGLQGDAFNRQLNWDVRQRYQAGEGDNSNGGALNMGWNGTYGQFGGNYSYSNGMKQTGVNARGAVLVHPQGITLSQSLGQTSVLVEAPGADGVAVGGVPGVATDFRGYTVLPYAAPYQENIVSLDPASFGEDLELPQTDMKVIPTEGALVRAVFTPRIGARALIHLRRQDGRPVPYGALSTLGGESIAGSGVVGSGGELYMSGLPAQGKLALRWGNEKGQACNAEYQLPERKTESGIYTFSALCQ